VAKEEKKNLGKPAKYKIKGLENDKKPGLSRVGSLRGKLGRRERQPEGGEKKIAKSGPRQGKIPSRGE